MTRWLDYLFDIWPFKGMKFRSIALPKNVQNFVKHQKDPYKLSKALKILPKLQNFAQSGHTGDMLASLSWCQHSLLLYFY